MNFKMAVMWSLRQRLLCYNLPLFKKTILYFSGQTASCKDVTDIVKSFEPQEKLTHTGQHWSKDDVRMVRFVDKSKQVNDQFAIDLINAIPPKPVKERVTWCDGGGGALGHPKVYINLDQPGPQICGYCGLRFVLETDHH